MLPLAVIGVEPLIIIMVIVLVLVGGQKIPELLRSVGRGVGELQNGLDSGRRAIRGSVYGGEYARMGRRRGIANGLARRARMHRKALSRFFRSLLGLPKSQDDEDDDDDWFDGGCPPPPSAVRIWTHDEPSDVTDSGAEPAVSQLVGSGRDR